MFIGVKKSAEQKLSSSHATRLLDLIYVPTKNYQVISKIMGVIMDKVRVLLNTTCPLVLIYASTKYYQNIANHIHKNLA